MTPCPIRVVKIGGSLLGNHTFPQQFQEWFRSQSPAANVLICGGGELADSIRRLDACYGLGDEPAHWLCVRLMSVTAQLVACVLNEPPHNHWLLVATRRELHERLAAGLEPPCVIFDPDLFLREEEAVCDGVRLPRNWSATSDSIAARVAEVLGAEELVLLKSADPPPTLEVASRRGYVDSHLAAAVARIPFVRAVNLWNRQESFLAGKRPQPTYRP